MASAGERRERLSGKVRAKERSRVHPCAGRDDLGVLGRPGVAGLVDGHHPDRVLVVEGELGRLGSLEDDDWEAERGQVADVCLALVRAAAREDGAEHVHLAPALRGIERRAADARRLAVNEVAGEVPDEGQRQHAPSLA